MNPVNETLFSVPDSEKKMIKTFRKKQEIENLFNEVGKQSRLYDSRYDSWYNIKSCQYKLTYQKKMLRSNRLNVNVVIVKEKGDTLVIKNLNSVVFLNNGFCLYGNINNQETNITLNGSTDIDTLGNHFLNLSNLLVGEK